MKILSIEIYLLILTKCAFICHSYSS